MGVRQAVVGINQEMAPLALTPVVRMLDSQVKSHVDILHCFQLFARRDPRSRPGCKAVAMERGNLCDEQLRATPSERPWEILVGSCIVADCMPKVLRTASDRRLVAGAAGARRRR